MTADGEVLGQRRCAQLVQAQGCQALLERGLLLELYLNEACWRSTRVDHVVGRPFHSLIGDPRRLLHVVGRARGIDDVEGSSGDWDDDIVIGVNMLSGLGSVGEVPTGGPSPRIVDVFDWFGVGHGVLPW
jgi:hypothetical protein